MTDLLYVPGRGLLYLVDPRVKFFFALALMGYLAFESETGALLLALLILHALALYCSDTRARILPLWRTLLPVLLVIILLGSLRWRAQPALLALGPLAVTSQALWTAAGVAARIAGISLAISLVLWTTEPGDAVAGLVRLGVPFAVGFPVIMALQYVVTFRRQFTHILEAQQSRGLAFSRGNPFQVARAYIPVLVPLIITALRSVDSLTLALESRGFGGDRKRTSRHVLHIRARDWIFVLATGCVLFALAQV
jgi:energy-coupling factor transport system permease protein